VSGRRILIAVGAVAAVVVVVVLWLGRSLDSVVKAGVERYGSRIAGTSVEVSGVRLELREARGTLRGLRIRNPGGFSGRDAVSLGEIVLDLEGKSLASEPIVIEELRIGDPRLLVEVATDGKVNLRALQHNVESYASPGGGSGPAPGGGGAGGGEAKAPPRILVKKVIVEGGKIRLDTRAVGGEETERDMAGLTLSDVGAPNGVRADHLGRKVLDALLSEALRGSAVQALRQKAEDELKQAGKGILKGLSD
jgi:hypothetical protein